MALTILSKTHVIKECNGLYYRISHNSKCNNNVCMTFGLYLPSHHPYNKNNNDSTHTTTNTITHDFDIPVLFWLSGLTCDDTNFAMKAGSIAFKYAEKNKMAIVMPDTSPRGSEDIPNDSSYDLGIGAGFYINATQSPWSKHFNMYTYITEELPLILQTEFGLVRKSITGHSMGGHGALTIALRNPNDDWKSVSALAPICNPTNCTWGQKAFTQYLGSTDAGSDYDATLLLTKYKESINYDDILIDQGSNDQFLHSKQLLPDAFVSAAKECNQKVTYREWGGFDHSYYFIAAFIRDHIEFHAQRLNK